MLKCPGTGTGNGPYRTSTSTLNKLNNCIFLTLRIKSTKMTKKLQKTALLQIKHIIRKLDYRTLQILLLMSL
jgi:hypothetical protein